MRALTVENLKTLYLNFTNYRDNHCNGHARMSIGDFYNKFGLGAYEYHSTKGVIYDDNI